MAVITSTVVSTDTSGLDKKLFNDFRIALARSVIMPALTVDRSAELIEGIKSISEWSIASIGEPEDTKEDGNEQSDNSGVLQKYTFTPTHDEKYNRYLYDKAVSASMNDYRQLFVQGAPYSLAKKLENRIALATIAAASADYTLTTTSRAGVDNAALGINDLQSIAELMDAQNLPQEGRVIVMRYNQKHELLKSAGVLEVQKAGTNSALVDAEFQRMYGFRLISTGGTNILDDDGTEECLAFHASACEWGYVAGPKYAEERQESKSRTYFGARQVYGVQANTRKDDSGTVVTRAWVVGKGTP